MSRENRLQKELNAAQISVAHGPVEGRRSCLQGEPKCRVNGKGEDRVQHRRLRQG